MTTIKPVQTEAECQTSIQNLIEYYTFLLNEGQSEQDLKEAVFAHFKNHWLSQPIASNGG